MKQCYTVPINKSNMFYLKKFETQSEYTDFKNNHGLTRPNVSWITEDAKPAYNVAYNAKNVVGSVLMWDVTMQRKFFILAEDLKLSAYPKDYFIPIGVVVIPSSHDVYGTGECGVMSLKGMNYYNPDNGGNDTNIYWGGYGTDIPELPNLTQVPLISTALTSNEIIGVTSNAYLPSTKFTSNKPVAGNGLDTLAGYYSKTCIPSPYLENGDRNPSYYTTDTTKYPGLSANCFSDFNGKSNTEIILNYATGQTDWRTASTITNSDSVGYYPAACCAWRYHTPGTNQGDWYLPAAGELGYMFARFNEIQTTLNKLYSLYGNSSVVSLRSSNYYWSSSEYSSYSARRVDTYDGNADYGSKSLYFYVRAWFRSQLAVFPLLLCCIP